MRPNNLCAQCDNARVREYNRNKRATAQGKLDHKLYMRDLRQRKRKAN